MIGGQLLMILCVIFYLTWWCIRFKPGGFETTFSMICLGCAFVSGLAGIFFNCHGIRTAGGDARAVFGLSNTNILIGCVILYFLLFAVLTFAVHRTLTTELLLIVGWLALELCTINQLCAINAFCGGVTIAFALITIAVSIASLACYLAYYKVTAVQGWIVGMIPLIIIGLTMSAVCAISWFTVHPK